jgi:hypothetical protein
MQLWLWFSLVFSLRFLPPYMVGYVVNKQIVKESQGAKEIRSIRLAF